MWPATGSPHGKANGTEGGIFDPTVYRGGWVWCRCCVGGGGGFCPGVGGDFSLVFCMILVDLFGFVTKIHGQRYWLF